jgi:hypothetical protein
MDNSRTRYQLRQRGYQVLQAADLMITNKTIRIYKLNDEAERRGIAKALD